MAKTILGLDLGTASIGWASVAQGESILNAGVRIFPEGMDRSRGEKSLNQDRREARQLRRQGYRRVRRKQKLKNALVRAGLLPAGDLAQLFKETNPYELRARALDKPLTLQELGRALFHLGQRRGYLSNRKTGSEKDGKVAAGISSVAQQMKQLGARTLGECLYLSVADWQHPDQAVRGVYTSRQMYLDEFEAIWRKQTGHHSQLTDRAKFEIHSALFEQRPLRVQKHLLGWCEFEADRRRAMAATLVAQEFRLWQNLNHLKIQFADGVERFLTDEERLLLHKKLSVRGSMGWSSIRTALGLYKDDGFNLERSRKSGIQGNVTASLVRNAFGKRQWDALTPRQHEQLVADVLNIEQEGALLNRLTKFWACERDAAIAVMDAGLKLPKGTMHLSGKAMRKIVAEMSRVSTPNNKGLRYDQACAAVYGHHSKKADHAGLSELPPLKEDLRNPLVQKSLNQVRQVVNAYIREHGKPDIIRIELARDLKLSSKQREEADKRSKQNAALNEKAKQFLEEFGIPNPSRTDLLKYRLWQELRQVCPYSGEVISAESLFGDHPRFQIEHIVPYSRCLDDSIANKTLCLDRINADKGNLTPYEYYEGRGADWQAVQQRLKASYMPFRKRKQFLRDDIPESLGVNDGFVSQQLNETRYIARKAVEYLAQLGVPVECVKGGTTALLRHAWGLDNILGNGEKTRADHRHHAVDAIAVALTDRRSVQLLSTKHQFYGERLRFTDIPEPIRGLRQMAEPIIKDMVVSHKVNRRVRGGLHDDTFYSHKGDHNETGVPLVAIRKPVASLSAGDLDSIRDARIQQLAKDHLAAAGGSLAEAFKKPDNPFGYTAKSGRFIPVRSVRLLLARSVQAVGEAERQRWVWTRGNHHVEICQASNGKWQSKVVDLLEAHRRKSGNIPVIAPPDDGEAFVMSLHINDMVSLDLDGQPTICRVQMFDRSGTMVLRRHNDATTSKENRAGEIRKKASSLQSANCEKLLIGPLGELRKAND